MKILPTFLDLVNHKDTPLELKELVEKCKTTPQTLKWHSEGVVYNHIFIVTNKCVKTTDIDMILSGFLHDLGKVECTKKHETKPDSWPAHGHELISTKLVEKYKGWIESWNANYENVHFIVFNHMKMHQIDKMRKSKQDKLTEHPAFHKLKLFEKFDSYQEPYIF